MAGTDRLALERFLNELLDSASFNDYGPNGLQIAGADRITRIAFAVSATAHSAAVAVDQKAQALVVHHGLFWQFHGVRTLTGPFARRVFPLVRHEINLFAYHLPLDAHPEIGNAAQLGSRIGLVDHQAFGDHQGRPTGISGFLPDPVTAPALRDRLQAVLDHPVLLASPDEAPLIRSVGIITGGANSGWTQALAAGLDAYITGEMSEHDWHEAREAGICLFAGGHNATEQFGIQALMDRVRAAFPAECFFIASDNPA
ncbi:MAG: Nif3-like dinuclear metal center hexameric protein [Gammaproteobacteria bacterium]|nr:Nif3-like dinuclear metal center hexameric protein [Gammaproteobacteria bacterium]